MVVRLAGHVGVDMPIQLEASGDPGLDQPVDGAEHRGATKGRFGAAHALVELGRGQLSAGPNERIRNDQPLPGDPLSGGREALGRGGGHRA